MLLKIYFKILLPCMKILKQVSQTRGPFDFMGTRKYIVRKVDFRTMRCEDGIEDNMVYSKDQVNK